MFSVTGLIKELAKCGQYLSPQVFTVIDQKDEKELYAIENISAGLMGLAVDYLTRYMNGAHLIDAFRISLLGADILGKKAIKNAETLINGIKGLDAISIRKACQLVGYDVCFRAGIIAYRPVETIIADDNTVENIKIMVERSLIFIKKFGPIVLDGFTFEGGYTEIVSSGDGDFLTKDTLWDFKVSKDKPLAKHILQLLMYYIMGKHSVHSEFQDITKIGIFNPRLNKVYLHNIADISPRIMETIEKDLIGYPYKNLKQWFENAKKKDLLIPSFYKKFG